MSSASKWPTPTRLFSRHDAEAWAQILVSDTIRPTSARAVEQLHEIGLHSAADRGHPSRCGAGR